MKMGKILNLHPKTNRAQRMTQTEYIYKSFYQNLMEWPQIPIHLPPTLLHHLIPTLLNMESKV